VNRLILCEGKTDAILISYYLAKTAGWQYSRTCPNGLDIKTNKGNEAIKCYVNNNEYLAICSVGGKDNFGSFFKTYI